MPVTLATPAISSPDDTAIEIGLLNNLGDAALARGVEQIVSKLVRASGDSYVRLRLFTFPEIPRGPATASHVALYTPFAQLYDRRLDALFVTGCEPRTAHLQDEPFWSRFREVVDWAHSHTRSTIWSCLAAHAAVLHLDGIERRRLTCKLSGLYPTVTASASRLDLDVGPTRIVPHSRCNDVAEDDLARAGYDILARGADIGVDAFVKRGRSTFLFLQGHPEYDPDALGREYRRDVMRYLHGVMDIYPRVPTNYVTPRDGDRLAAFEEKARAARDPALFAQFPRLEARPRTDDDVGVHLFARWLEMVRLDTARHAA